MPFYTLVIPDEPGRSLNTPAKDRGEALAMFAKELGHQLTDQNDGGVAPYLLDEWDKGPHWTNATISIFKVIHA
jgi:hypothetical protein